MLPNKAGTLACRLIAFQFELKWNSRRTEIEESLSSAIDTLDTFVIIIGFQVFFFLRP
jgi:hypothetical protein